MKFSKITNSQYVKILKTALYVGVSAILGWAIAEVQKQPELFGVYAPIVNIILVTIKQTLTEDM